MAARPGWYRDRQDPTIVNFWDGTKWTGESRPIADVAPGASMQPATGGKNDKAKSKEKPAKKPRSSSGTSSIMRLLIAVLALAVVAAGGYLAYTTLVVGQSDSSDPVPAASQPAETSSAAPSADPAASAPATPSAEPTPTVDPALRGALISELTNIGRTLEDFKADNGSYPNIKQANELGLTTTADVVKVSYYDSNLQPVNPEKNADLSSFVICADSASVGEAFFYDSVSGGLVIGTFPAGSCDIFTPLTSAEPVLVWTPADADIILQATPVPTVPTSPEPSLPASSDAVGDTSATPLPSNPETAPVQ